MTRLPTPRIFLLRHGRSEANEQRLIASRPDHAGDAFGLTPAGADQVRTSVADALDEGALAPPRLVIASPLLRARETAAVAAEFLDVTPSVDARLTERDFGELELASDERYREVWEADLADPRHRRRGVESVTDVLGRAGTLVEEVARRRDVATVILCTHGDVASVLLCAAAGSPLTHHRQVGAMATGTLRVLPSAESVVEALRDLDRQEEHPLL